MYNLKDIRSDLKNFENKIKQRNFLVNIQDLQKLDNKNRNLIQKKRKTRTRKKNYLKIKR